MLKFLQARNQPFPPGTPDDEIDGFRYVRREAVKALAQCRYPTLSTLPDKPHPTWVLLKIAARDGMASRSRAWTSASRRPSASPTPSPNSTRTTSRITPPTRSAYSWSISWRSYVEEKRTPDKPPTQAVEGRGQPVDRGAGAHEGAEPRTPTSPCVVDATNGLLANIEKALSAPNATELEEKLKGEASPSNSLYQSVPESKVTFGGKPAAPPKPDEKKDK